MTTVRAAVLHETGARLEVTEVELACGAWISSTDTLYICCRWDPHPAETGAGDEGHRGSAAAVASALAPPR